MLESFNRPYEPPPAEAEKSETNRKPSPPEIVTRAVLEALFSEKPKLRYMVGTQWEGDRVLHALVEKLLDENDNPQHNYSREQNELFILCDKNTTFLNKCGIFIVKLSLTAGRERQPPTQLFVGAVGGIIGPKNRGAEIGGGLMKGINLGASPEPFFPPQAAGYWTRDGII